MYNVIVVGAGHNGLVAAAYLARAGLRVAVFERREIVGGAAVSEALWPGWSVSTGAYVCSLLHPSIIRDLDLAAHGYEAYPKDPASFTPLADGRSLLLSRDDAANAREIAAFEPRDVLGFEAFNREAIRLGGVLSDAFDADDIEPSPIDSVSLATMQGSAAALVERFVQTPVLAATLATDGVIGTDAGPRDPGTGYVLAHHYAGRAFGTRGQWGYVRGGMGSVTRALANAARAAGAEIHTTAPVARIDVRDGVARRVILQTGSALEATTILSNADPITTFSELIGAAHLPPALSKKLAGWRCEGVSLKVNLALGELPNFTARPGTHAQQHHRATVHVAPSIDYLQSAYTHAKQHGASSAPMLECFMQTPTDPDLAPPGKHLLSVFAQYFPYRRADGPWTVAKREAAGDAIVATLAQYAPNVPGSIEARQVLTPPDLESRFGLHGGQIFHGDLLPGQILGERFEARTPIEGLFLCGSGTLPGGCVSGIAGLRAARAVLRSSVKTP